VILGIFKREKQKIAMVTLPCVFRKTHGKVTKTNSKNSAFVVRLWRRTTKVPFIAVRFLPRRTAKISSLPCVLLPAHGKGCHTPFDSGAVSCFFCRAS
jgi:hypothetical protein